MRGKGDIFLEELHFGGTFERLVPEIKLNDDAGGLILPVLNHKHHFHKNRSKADINYPV